MHDVIGQFLQVATDGAGSYMRRPNFGLVNANRFPTNVYLKVVYDRLAEGRVR